MAHNRHCSTVQAAGQQAGCRVAKPVVSCKPKPQHESPLTHEEAGCCAGLPDLPHQVLIAGTQIHHANLSTQRTTAYMDGTRACRQNTDIGISGGRPAVLGEAPSNARGADADAELWCPSRRGVSSTMAGTLPFRGGPAGRGVSECCDSATRACPGWQTKGRGRRLIELKESSGALVQLLSIRSQLGRLKRSS